MNIDAWTGLGGSWGRPWGSFWLPRPPRTKKQARRAKCVRLGAPIWGSMFDIFCNCSMFLLRSFSSLRFGGYQDRCLVDFIICGIIFRSLFHNFPDCRQIRKMSFWYSIYDVYSTSASWKRADQIEIPGHFRTLFPRWPPTSFFHRCWADWW